jgi:hypothetical protein
LKENFEEGYMNTKSILLSLVLVILLLTVGFFVAQSQARPYALIMQDCGGTFYLAGDHITWHGTVEEAKQHAESRFGQNGFDLASIAQSAQTGIYTDLLWMKTTSTACYDGRFMDWTSNP